MNINVDVSLEDFYDDDIVEYAEDSLGMFQEQSRIYDFDTDDLLEELSCRGIPIFDFDFPHNIMSKDLIEGLYENIDKVDFVELEQFLKKYYD